MIRIVSSLLGGFHRGYSMADLADWIEFHRKREGEIIWIIVDPASDDCIGHVGLYNIDYRVRSA
jgi:RimJ/RimL family protein N-acetyltransferase